MQNAASPREQSSAGGVVGALTPPAVPGHKTCAQSTIRLTLELTDSLAGRISYHTTRIWRGERRKTMNSARRQALRANARRRTLLFNCLHPQRSQGYTEAL